MAFNKEVNQFVINNYKKEIRKLKKQIKKNDNRLRVLSHYPEFTEEYLMKIKNESGLLADRIVEVNDLIAILTKLENEYA